MGWMCELVAEVDIRCIVVSYAIHFRIAVGLVNVPEDVNLGF